MIHGHTSQKCVFFIFFTVITSNLTPNLLRLVKIIVVFMLCVTASPRGDIGIDRWYLAKKGWKSTATAHKTSTIKVYVSSQELTHFLCILNIGIFHLELLYVLKSISCGCSAATIGCSFLIGCSSCVTNSQSEGEKYCFFHPTQFSGPWVGTWRYVSSVVFITLSSSLLTQCPNRKGMMNLFTAWCHTYIQC